MTIIPKYTYILHLQCTCPAAVELLPLKYAKNIKKTIKELGKDKISNAYIIICKCLLLMITK